MPKMRQHGDGALFFDPHKRLWRGTVEAGRSGDGQRLRKEVSSRDRKKCIAKVRQARKDIEENGGLAPLKVPTLATWAQLWLTTRAVHQVDPKTFATYKSLTKRWIVPALGHKPVDQIRASDVAKLRARIVDEAGRSTSTARQAQIVLSLMLDAAKADRLIRHDNPAKLIRKPKGAKTKRGAIPTEDAVRLLRVAAGMPHGDGSRWWAKLLLGLRQGEILGARIADLDLDAGIYTVSWKLEDIPREHGCGGTCQARLGATCPQARWRIPDDYEWIHLVGRWCLTRPKSKTGRIVPLVPQVAEAIRRCLIAHADEPNPHGLIWRNPDGAPIDPKLDAAQWRDLLQSAGLITSEQNRPAGTILTGHWARHTTVTVLAEMGVDFQIIGEIVGHSSAQVTAIYRHAQEREKRAAMELIAGAWGEALAIEA